MPDKDYKKIPLNKLERIHYAQVKVIKDRVEKGLTDGVKIKFKNPLQLQNDLIKLLNTIFEKADNEFKGDKEELLGMHYLVGTFYALPLDALKKQELEIQAVIKKRKEIRRQQLNAGTIDNIIKKGGG